MDLNIDIKDLMKIIQGKAPATSGGEGTAPAAKPKKIKKGMNPIEKAVGKYMLGRETILGVDITPHYIRLCQMKNVYDQWTLNNLASACMESQFRNSDIIVNPDLYVENLKDLIKKNKISTKDVAFSIPTASTIIKVLRIPDMSDEDFVQAAALGSIWESMVMLEGSISEYSVYYKILRHNPAPEMPAAPVVEAIPQTDVPLEIAVETAPVEPVLIPTETVPEAPVEIAAETPAENTLTEAIAPEITPADDAALIPSEIPAEISLDAALAPAADYSAQTDMTGLEGFNTGLEQSFEVAPALPEGPTMDVLFVASKLSDIYLHADIIRRAGLNPVLADTRCLALKHAFESNPKNLEHVTKPYAFMEFGPDDNYIFVVDDNHSEVYKLYVSDDDITTLIYNPNDLEKLKEFVANFASQAQQILDNHQAAYNTPRVNFVFVSSSAPLHVNDASSVPLIKSFVEHMSRQLGGREVKECNFCSHIIVPEKFAKKVNAEGNISAWASTVGIASRKLDIFGYEDWHQPPLNTVNLLPGAGEDKRGKCLNIISSLAASVVFFIFLAGVGTSYLDILRTGQSLTSQIQNMATVENDYNAKVSEAQKLTLILNQVNSLDDIKKSLPSNQKSILAAYDRIVAVIPDGIWLSTVKYTLPNALTIEGRATSDQHILAFVKKLNSGTEFAKVSLKTMEVDKQVQNANNPIISSEPVKVFSLLGILSEDASSATGLEILQNSANPTTQPKAAAAPAQAQAQPEPQGGRHGH